MATHVEDEDSDYSSGEDRKPVDDAPMRSHVIRRAETQRPEQSYWVGDKVEYKYDIYDVLSVEFNERRQSWRCKIQREGGSETKTVDQERIARLNKEGPNHPWPVGEDGNVGS